MGLVWSVPLSFKGNDRESPKRGGKTYRRWGGSKDVFGEGFYGMFPPPPEFSTPLGRCLKSSSLARLFRKIRIQELRWPYFRGFPPRGASFKVDRAHFTASTKGPENHKNEVKLRPPLCRPLKHSMNLPPPPPRKYYENNSPRIFLCNFWGRLRQNCVITKKLIPEELFCVIGDRRDLRLVHVELCEIYVTPQKIFLREFFT